MKRYPLVAYFLILIVLCAAVIGGARALGEQGAYLAQVYMLTPALAALLTRIFFYQPRFKDANLRLGKASNYLRFWLLSLGITALSYLAYTLLGAVAWDLSGASFLERLGQQFAAAGQDITEGLPPGFTPQMMLWLFTIGGLTVFNVFPGILTGFGEEFGHRGFMFPLLYRVRPWVGLVVGGLIWFAWHVPLRWVLPPAQPMPLWQVLLNGLALGVGSVCTFVYLAYVYVKSRSVWVASLAHITLNNAAASFSYFVVIQDQFRANLGLVLTMVLVAAIVVFGGGLRVMRAYFAEPVA